MPTLVLNAVQILQGQRPPVTSYPLVLQDRQSPSKHSSDSPILFLWRCFTSSLSPEPPPRPTSSLSLCSQPCGLEHTLHLIMEYYLTVPGGQHSSTSGGFCQRCIYLLLVSISVVPPTEQGYLCDLCRFSSAHTPTVSLSRFFSLLLVSTSAVPLTFSSFLLI